MNEQIEFTLKVHLERELNRLETELARVREAKAFLEKNPGADQLFRQWQNFTSRGY